MVVHNEGEASNTFESFEKKQLSANASKQDQNNSASDTPDQKDSDVIVGEIPTINPDDTLKEYIQQQFEGIDLKDLRVYLEDEDYRVLLDKIYEAQKVSVRLTLKNDFYIKTAQGPNDIKVILDNEVDMCLKQMEEINRMNWQYLIIQKNGRRVAINDFDCMKINHR